MATTGYVYLSVYGDGSASTDAVPPLVDGESFTLTSIPYAGATLDDIRVYDSWDYPIATTVAQEVTITYRRAYRNIYIEVYFSGSSPPTPPTPKDKLFWLIMGLKKNNERRLKPYVRN